MNRIIILADGLDATKTALEQAKCIHEGVLSYDAVRQYFSYYTLVYESAGGSILDISADFMKQGISEHFLFVSMLLSKPGFEWTPLVAPKRMSLAA